MASLKLSKAFAEDAAVCSKIGVTTVSVHGEALRSNKD